MGAVRVTIAALNPQGQRSRELEATVDTGSTYTQCQGRSSRGWECRYGSSCPRRQPTAG